MKIRYSARPKIKQLDVTLHCVNCDKLANAEDIKFGCIRCADYKLGGAHGVPSWWELIHPEGGWYQYDHTQEVDN